jgi:hypothetical protein
VLAVAVHNGTANLEVDSPSGRVGQAALRLGAGGILGGIAGAFLAVPVAAVVVATGSYLRGQPVGEPAEPGEPEPETSGRH